MIVKKLVGQEKKDYKYLRDTYGNSVANTFKQQILSLKNKTIKESKKKRQQNGVLPKNKMQECAKILTSFWKVFVTAETPEQKLQTLKYHSTIKLYRFYGKGLAKRREDFLNDKTLVLKNNDKCSCCGNKATERHHIIQLKNGGTNVKRNIIPICTSCHSEIHPWLAE